MGHNPAKNRAVCVIAKSTVWGLRGLLTVLIGFGVIGIAVVAVDTIRAKWNWAEFRKGALALVFLIIFAAVTVGVINLLNYWYQWAKRYTKDC